MYIVHENPVALSECNWVEYEGERYHYPVFSTDEKSWIALNELIVLCSSLYISCVFDTGNGFAAVSPYNLYLDRDQVLLFINKFKHKDEKWFDYLKKGGIEAHLRVAGKYTIPLIVVKYVYGDNLCPHILPTDVAIQIGDTIMSRKIRLSRIAETLVKERPKRNFIKG